jgi:hypothetical protein
MVDNLAYHNGVNLSDDLTHAEPVRLELRWPRWRQLRVSRAGVSGLSTAGEVPVDARDAVVVALHENAPRDATRAHVTAAGCFVHDLLSGNVQLTGHSHVGLGGDACAREVTVRWPDGTKQELGDVRAGGGSRSRRELASRRPGSKRTGDPSRDEFLAVRRPSRRSSLRDFLDSGHGMSRP